MSDPLAPNSSSIALADGDRAASAGDWPRAIAIWRQLALDNNEAATERLRWFLNETSPHRAWRGASPPRQRAMSLLLPGVGCGVTGTVLVLIAQHESGTTQGIMVSAAWILFLATGILAIWYAYLVGRPSKTSNPALTLDDIESAVNRAHGLETEPGLGKHVS